MTKTTNFESKKKIIHPYCPQKNEHYGLVIAQDFLKRRTNLAELRLCHQCPAPQSQKGQPKYTINCEEHKLK